MHVAMMHPHQNHFSHPHTYQPPANSANMFSQNGHYSPDHQTNAVDYSRTADPHAVRRSQQFAYPIRAVPYSDNGTPARLGASSVLDENMLRRKTPQGTITGAYESNPHDTQAAKHMLLPRNESYQSFAQFPQMVDSVLHQNTPYPRRQAVPAHQFFGRTVPSVIQPPFHHLGPTASGVDGRGPFGPYWNDGTFVPYRPAALRDPRFYHQGGDARWGSAGSGGPYEQMPSWQSGAPPLVYPVRNTPIPIHGAPAWPQPAGAGMGPLGGAAPTQSVSYAPDSQHTANPLIEGSKPSEAVPDFGPGPATAQQRERAFQWALQIYRDLLAYIHQVKRRDHQNKQVSATQFRPNFFPKPPKLSGAPFPSPSNGPPHDSLDMASEEQGWSDTELQGHQLGGRSHAPRHVQPAPALGHNPALLNPAHPSRTLLRSHSYPSAVPALTPAASPPLQRPIDALALMSRLCQETEWQWIDGIHLGGCLAYGLGSYNKAHRWYTKVLALDPRHVEATSNLAATLVLLGRKKEAEEHWMKVVKYAPNHFEAVEHLVGLLCQNQRAKEAMQVIEYVQRSLRLAKPHEPHKTFDQRSECSTASTASRSPCLSELSDVAAYDFEGDGADYFAREPAASAEPGFGSSGFAIPGCDNGRILSLIHAKGNMLYSLGDTAGAAKAFEEAVLLATGRKFASIRELIKHVLLVISDNAAHDFYRQECSSAVDPVLLYPEQAAMTATHAFPPHGELAGLRYVPPAPHSVARNAAMATTSNSLLSLAKIFQDSMSTNARGPDSKLVSGVRDILALYYLSLSFQPSPSTANNVGILLAGVQQSVPPAKSMQYMRTHKNEIPGVTPGSGIALALAYYSYGLHLDSRHAHLYTNLGSLLKDIGQLDAAIEMYKRAVQCDPKFDIALANLANAVKDKGRISDAIEYYKRAVEVSPDFAEAVCGLANALNSVCSWAARGGIVADGGKRDRWHVDAKGMLTSACDPGAKSSGWIARVVEIVERQLRDGEDWGKGVLLQADTLKLLLQSMAIVASCTKALPPLRLRRTLEKWAGKKWEGARVTRLVERAIRRITWHWYQDLYVHKRTHPPQTYARPQLPAALSVPNAPTVLPFHTFTCPMSAKQVRLISQRNAFRISVATLRSPWLPPTVYPPPPPPNPALKVGYVSSDFNNHPLAHLMQSVFGMHDPARVEAYCYATTASDNSVYRQQIEAEAPHFYDASAWSTEALVNKIVRDGIHVLVNLNGYTRGARNEVFAARPAPVQMSFMGFAGTLGAEWCDYLLADAAAVPPHTLRPNRRNVDIADVLVDETTDDNGDVEDGDESDATIQGDAQMSRMRQAQAVPETVETMDADSWVYGENIIYCRDTFFCCDHRQSAPDSQEKRLDWEGEQMRRWKMRKELFPKLPDDAVIFGNFNQLYKLTHPLRIDPTTLRTWLRILSALPNAYLWLLRFPDLGEPNIITTARLWASDAVASRILFTDVAPKALHISRARVCDLFLDTPECNAHTTAADCLWSGTPLLTLGRWGHKMCSRMAGSILLGALPKSPPEVRDAAESDLIAKNEAQYEELAIRLGRDLTYPRAGRDVGRGKGRLVELRKLLTEARWSSALFDTRRWVSDLEDGMEEAWRRWVEGSGGDIWLEELPRGGRGRGRSWGAQVQVQGQGQVQQSHQHQHQPQKLQKLQKRRP